MKKILFYTNQFFGQIGGEDMAYAEPQVFEGMHGSANTFGAPLKDIAEIVATIVCGDNFYAENMETGRAFLLEQIKKYQPDLIIAGPAFNAGRFGHRLRRRVQDSQGAGGGGGHHRPVRGKPRRGYVQEGRVHPAGG